MEESMNGEELLEEAKKFKGELIEKRRYLHKNAETGFDLTKTLKFVETELINMGYNPIHCGKAGLVVTVGGNIRDMSSKLKENNVNHELIDPLAERGIEKTHCFVANERVDEISKDAYDRMIKFIKEKTGI